MQMHHEVAELVVAAPARRNQGAVIWAVDATSPLLHVSFSHLLHLLNELFLLPLLARSMSVSYGLDLV